MIVKSFRSEQYSLRYCIFTNLSNLKTRLTHSDPLPDSTRCFGSGKALTRPNPTQPVRSFNPIITAIITRREAENTASNTQHDKFPEGKSLKQSQHARKPVTVTHSHVKN